MQRKKIRFAVIGDCHYSEKGNYATRDCLGARRHFGELLEKLNGEDLDFVLCLGDLGNGDAPDEAGQMLAESRKSIHPVKFVIGNHDLVQRSDEEHARLVGMPDLRYEFSMGGHRFIVLNAFEQSRYSRNEADYAAYRAFRDSHPWLKVQEWPGMMREDSWKWLKGVLDSADAAGEDIVIFSHVPVWYGTAQGPSGLSHAAHIPDFQRMLDLLDGYPTVRAYIAGHHHPGGLAVRRGVLHKTLVSLCDNPPYAACIAEADGEKMTLRGIGAEKGFVHEYAVRPCVISGTAPAGSVVMTDCGELCHVGADGRFELSVPCPGQYCLKAMMDGFDDAYEPRIHAPASGIDLALSPNPARRLYTGSLPGYHVLHVTDGGKPVRWFDVAGTLYGSYEPESCAPLSTAEAVKQDKPPVSVWHEHSRNYFCHDEYAFTAESAVQIDVLPKHEALKEAGWFKGDLHAHMIHGENFYIGNAQLSGFISRAEGYDWLYMAMNHGNDGDPADVMAVAEAMSGPDYLYRMNQEFPKARGNHFGNCCVQPPCVQADMTKISSIELADEYIWKRGGVTVPVHPFEGHMCFREMPLWLNCAADKMPCMDFFYHDNYPHEMAEDYWFMLLNRGYEIGCFCSSDGAFDVGRTPGSDRGCTYLKMDALSEEGIKDAILHRRTMVSWDCAAIVFSVDGALSGDHLPADGTRRAAKAEIRWRAGRTGTFRFVMNGQAVLTEKVAFSSDDEVKTVTLPFTADENGWILPILENEDGRFRSAASPVFFRNADFVPPEKLPLPQPCPEELLAECNALTALDLTDPALIDRFADKLRAYEKEAVTCRR